MLVGSRIVAFFLGSAVFLYLSRRPLRDIRSHGFYRFFAWEAILALVLWNANYWVRDPFSLAQIISWLCLSASLYLVAHGVQLLRRVGQPTQTRRDETLLGMESTGKLVTVGAYRYIRHPLYSSLLFLAWGAFFKSVSWPSASLTAMATFFLWATSLAEEAENIRYFGPSYSQYMKRTKRFIPFLF